MTDLIKFSSRRLMLTLMLCACSVVLLQNHNVSPRCSFSVNLLCMLGGLAVCAVLLIPSVIIKKRFDSDVPTLARQATPRLKIPLSCFYALYFTYVSSAFLLEYTDLFSHKYYPGVSPCVVGACLLGICVYAAFRGVNIITRIGIFLFAFALFTNALLFSGCVSSVDFQNGSFALSGTVGEGLGTLCYFCTPAFIAVIYGSVAGQTRDFRFRQPLLSLLFTAVKFALVMFFVTFALGSYAERQNYQSFVLSRVAHFGGFAGVESIFIALATVSVMMVISLSFCCIGRFAGRERTLKTPLLFAAVLMTVSLVSRMNNSVKEIFASPALLFALTVAAAGVIPTAYIFIGGKKNEA